VIVKALRARHPMVPVIAFPRAAGLLYEDYVSSVPADCIGLDNTVPLAWACARIQRDLGRCIQGNLDPQLLVAGGAALEAETDRILARRDRRARFVFQPRARHSKDDAAGACSGLGQAGSILACLTWRPKCPRGLRSSRKVFNGEARPMNSFQPAFSLKDMAGETRRFPTGRPSLVCFLKEDCHTCDLAGRSWRPFTGPGATGPTSGCSASRARAMR